MTDYFNDESERRSFFRYDIDKPIQYKVVKDSVKKAMPQMIKEASSKNVSASGILIRSANAPQISSLILLDFDYRTTNLCLEIENRAITVGNKILGKVVRLEESDVPDHYDIGIAFLTDDDKNSIDLDAILKGEN